MCQKSAAGSPHPLRRTKALSPRPCWKAEIPGKNAPAGPKTPRISGLSGRKRLSADAAAGAPFIFCRPGT